MAIVITIVSIVLLFFVVESIFVRYLASKIAQRILVSGTRGKSTLVKYIHAGLSKNNNPVLAKVTGEIPTLILPGGRRTEIRRRGRARIQEQFRTIRKAANAHANVLVLECMAIDPDLQQTVSRFFRPHFFVLSNIRDDHREKMGSTRDLQERNFLRTIPRNSHIFTADEKIAGQLGTISKKRNSVFSLAEKLTPAEQDAMPKNVFPENVALALAVCQSAGINRETAFEAIREHIEVEASTEEVLRESGKNGMRGKLINAFSVNDPESLDAFLLRALPGYPAEDTLRLIFNTRRDRPLRTKQFCRWIKQNQPYIQSVLLTGDHSLYALRSLYSVRKSVDVRILRRFRSREPVAAMIRKTNPGETFVGVGNIAGMGYKIIEEFKRIQ